MRADLHSHSTRSDGALSPAALVELVVAHGVTHLALTDHDTLDGVQEAAQAAHRAGRKVQIVAGIEITASFHEREVHLLGHFVLPDAPALRDWTASRLAERQTRMTQMVERLQSAGLAVSMDDVEREAGGGVLARPHLARALVARGYAENVGRAFDRFLQKGAPGWVERRGPTIEEAVRVVREAGGTSSLAHPGANRISRQEVRALAAAGVDALEAFHPDHPPNQADAYVRWGRALGLHATGGSDFHAPGEHSTPPGTFVTPVPDWRALTALAAERQAAEHLAGARARWAADGGWLPGAPEV